MRWSQCFTSVADNSVLLPRFGHSAVAVASQQLNTDLVVVYGGVGQFSGDSAQTALADVVVLQVESSTWFNPETPHGSTPGARSFHSAEALGSKMLVFGGHILTYDQDHNKKRRQFYNDVWQLDTDDWHWRRLPTDASPTHPPRRDMAAMLLLDGNRLLLFGGRSEQGRALQDTWLFDISQCTWLQLKPEGPLPPPRKMHSMVKMSGQVVLYGGERDNGPLDDLWVLRGLSSSFETPRWTQIRLKPSPGPRFGHAMVTVPGPAAGTPPRSRRTSSASSLPAAEGIADSQLQTAAAANDSQHQQAASTERLVLFGGCLDLTSFLSLNRHYVQSKETWVLDLNRLMWLKLPDSSNTGAATAAAEGPCERMCHSLVALPPGRLLLIGGRHKEGICKDFWWFDPSGELPQVPPSPRPPAATSSSPAMTPTAAAPAASRAGSSQGSLLQTLLAPISRSRGASQGHLQQPGSSTSTTPTTSQPPSPRSQQQQQQQGNDDHTSYKLDADVSLMLPPIQTDANAAQRLQQPAASLGPAAAAARDFTLPADIAGPTTAAAAPSILAGSSSHQHKKPSLPPKASVTSSAAAAAALSAAGGNNSISGSIPATANQQPLAALVDVGQEELTKLLRSPAAYSAGALNKLSTSVASFLAGQSQQAGSLAGALPAALSRYAPSFLPGGNNGSVAASSSGSTLQQQQQQQQHLGLMALRAQMGLPSVPSPAAAESQQAAAALIPAAAAVAVNQSLAYQPGAIAPVAAGLLLHQLVLSGQQLLGDKGAVSQQPYSSSSGSGSGSSLPPDVLISAARQHLMSTPVEQLKIQQVGLLLADYQQLAAIHCEQQLLSRLSDGFEAAAIAAPRPGNTFLIRQPKELLVSQVGLLQAEYQQLVVEANS